MASGKSSQTSSLKKSKESQVFKLLRSLAEDLCKVRRGKEKFTEEFLADFVKCLEKAVQALPLLDPKFCVASNGLVYEICTELTLLLRDKSYLPVFARLILSFSKNTANSVSQLCIIKMLSFIDFRTESECSANKHAQKEALASVKLPKDKEKKKAAKEACNVIIRSACRTSFGHDAAGPSGSVIRGLLAKMDAEYHSKAPKKMIDQ